MTPFRLGKKEAGFTLVELVLVIVVIGILAVFAVPRLVDTTATKAGALARKLQSDIAYAQELAMTRNLRYRVYVNAAPAPVPAGYAVTDSAGAVVPDPAGGNLSVTLNSGSYAGITISGGFSGSFIEFNTLGVPYDNAGISLAAATVLTINANAAPERTVTIQPQTGKVSSP